MALIDLKITQEIKVTRSIVFQIEAESDTDALVEWHDKAPPSDDPRWKILEEKVTSQTTGEEISSFLRRGGCSV